MKPIFIAEVKTRSPYGYVAQKRWRDLFDIANEHGDWISVHTDERWGGDWGRLGGARKLTNKPILAKGIHLLDAEIEKAFDFGADYVLCVGRIPDKAQIDLFETPGPWTGKVIVEPLREKAGALAFCCLNGQKVCCNARDLSTGEFVGLPSAAHLRAVNYTDDLWLCQASGIKAPDQILKGYSAFIVGEHLETFVEELKHESN